MEMYKNIPTCYANDAAVWSEWFRLNMQKYNAVFLILYKKGCGTPSITYDEAVNVALCYGWIDSKINKRDEISWYQYFAKRNPKSNWSRVNKAKIEKLMAEGRMETPGMEMVRIAMQSGTWTALDEVEALILPVEMKQMMEENQVAHKNWEAFPKSVKRGILEWIFNAKRPQTKIERIKNTVSAAADNRRINFDRS